MPLGRVTLKVSRGRVSPIPLCNDGSLTLTFLGCGSAFAKTLDQTNLLIVKGSDHLLIDMGATTPKVLHKHGVSVSEIDHFLITHSHADHVGGLEEVQLFNRYVARRKANMIITKEYEKLLWNESLRGGSEWSEGRPLKFTDLWNVQRPKKINGYLREVYQTQVGTISIKMFRTKHFPDSAKCWRDSAWSCGILIDDHVLFTSDTRFDPELLEEFDSKHSLSAIFHDCQLFTGGVHTGIEELATLPAELKQKLVLVHYGDGWRDHREFARKAGFHSWGKALHTYRFD